MVFMYVHGPCNKNKNAAQLGHVLVFPMPQSQALIWLSGSSFTHSSQSSDIQHRASPSLMRLPQEMLDMAGDTVTR